MRGLNAWLIYDEGDAERNKEYIKFYFKECAAREIKLSLLLAGELLPGISGGGLNLFYKGKALKKPDFAIMRYPCPFLSEHIESMGIPLFNCAEISRVANDKRKSYMLAKNLGLPVLDSFFPHKGAEDVPANLPAIVKPARGRGGRDVYLARDEGELSAALSRLRGEDVVVQRAAADLGRDLRVYAIGGQIIAAILRENKKSHKANLSHGASARRYTLSEEERCMASAVIKKLPKGYIGVDFIFEGGSPVFNEIEDVVGARALYELTDLNPAAMYLDWIVSEIGGKNG